MRNIVLDLAVTLDGFIEGPNGEIDWCIMDDDMGFEEFLASIDTIFYGRVSYDMWGNYQPEPTATETEKDIWAAVHSKQKFVFSSRPRQDENAMYISSDIARKVEEIKNTEGKDIWLYGGAKLITTFINLGLVDRYRVAVHPTVLGAGKPLFGHINDRLNLVLTDVKKFKSGVVQLIYAPQQTIVDD
uniref:Dihydrofolate reductase family protein n=1 Tax=Roseihalotalea indica TaxID=2867963 RepID=A0AA49GTY2_9BACT|nr:dihydrofolate reductase family protein [Tunicatimonas sp. TK19036]